MTSTGTVLGGRYRLTALLGRGARAQVWSAYDDVVGRPVAVKVFEPDGAGGVAGAEFDGAGAGSGPDRSGAERATAELRTLAALSHPNLLAVFDAGHVGGQPYLVVELVGGRTFAQRIAAVGALAPVEVATVGAQVAAGLAYLHQRGIVHRDVTPANVLLRDPEPDRDHSPDHGRRSDVPTALLADVGIALTAGSAVGVAVGTVAYLAPEQATGRPVGPAADVWALGLVLLEALTGRPGRTGPPSEAAAARLVTAPAIPDSLGSAWRYLLASMTAVSPSDRPTAAQVDEKLTDAVRTSTSRAMRHGQVAPHADQAPPIPDAVGRAPRSRLLPEGTRAETRPIPVPGNRLGARIAGWRSGRGDHRDERRDER